jgi:GAF domain-containing protein
VFDDAAKVLYGSPYNSAILIKDDARGPGRLHLVHRGFSHGASIRSRFSELEGSDQTPPAETESSISVEAIAPYFVIPERLTPRPVIVPNVSASPLPQELLEIPRQMSCDSAAFIPVIREGQVVALLALGKSEQEKILPPFTMLTLGPYLNLIERMVMTLERIQTQQGTQRLLAELQTIWNISQKISGETNLDALFQEIHQQVESVMGEIYSEFHTWSKPEGNLKRLHTDWEKT